MKTITLIIFCVALSMSNKELNKSDYLCKKWIQVGMKTFNKSYKSIEGCAAKKIEFSQEGKYSEELYCQLKFGGDWKYNNDSTKLTIAITEMNGQHQKNAMGIEDSKPTIIILKLSADTLILGYEAFYGQENIYGHDDYYYIVAKQ